MNRPRRDTASGCVGGGRWSVGTGLRVFFALYPEHRAARCERSERFGQRLLLLRQLVHLPEELDAARHLLRELSQDGSALLERQLHSLTRSSLDRKSVV